MHTLVVFAIGIFTALSDGHTVQGVSQVASITQCAELINSVRHPLEADDGDTYYLTSATCMVREQ